MLNRWPLVGRHSELTALRSSIAVGATVVLSGAPGTGKTRLAVECLSSARERGYQTVRVAATRCSTAVPLGAFAAVAPELSPQTDGSTMLRHLTRRIARRNGRRPLALLVDDAHLLDDMSAVLTHQVAVSQSIYLLLTVGTGSEVPEPVRALWKDEIAERIDLAPLPPSAIADLLARVLGGAVEEASARWLHDRCAGNVLFLRETVLAALEGGVLAHSGDEWIMHHEPGLFRLRERPLASARLRELVGARYAGLDGHERDVLEAIALGEPLPVAFAERLSPRVRLSDLEQRDFLLIEGRREDSTVRLENPVYAEAVRASLSVHRRQETFRRLADALEAQGITDADDLLRLACWRLEGGGHTEPEVMSIAARRAWVLHDPRLAERLAGAAVDAGAGFETEVFLAHLRGLVGYPEEAEAQLSALVPKASGDAELGAVAIARIDNLCYSLGALDKALSVADLAEDSIADRTARDVVTAYKASVHQLRGRVTDMVSVSEPLLNRASGRALVWACVMAAGGYAHTGRFTAAVETARRGRRAHLILVENLLDVPFPWQPSVHDAGECLALAFAGRLSEAEEIASAAYETGIREDSPATRFTMAIPLCTTYLAQGRVRSALRCARANVTFTEDHGRLVSYRPLLEVLMAEALAFCGETDEAAAMLRDLDNLDRPFVHVWDGEAARARAWLAAALGNLTEARRTLLDAAMRARAGGAWVAEAAALHDAVRLGAPSLGADRLVELAEVIEGPYVAAQAAHARGVLEQDGEALLGASDRFQVLGALLLAAECAADAATAWRRRGASRQAGRAERRARELARCCEGARTPALANTVDVRAALTERLREIGTLAAGGLSNKEIADRLSLSVRTVENKLYTIYEKLGVRSREELADVLSPERIPS